MNKLLYGFLGVLLLGGTAPVLGHCEGPSHPLPRPGTARALPGWTGAQGGFDDLQESQARLKQTAQLRQSQEGVPIAAVVVRLREAAERLVRADRENPKTRLDDWEIRGNPYRTAPGDNGKVDASEAKSTADRVAISFYEAAANLLGEVYAEGGGPEGFKEKIMTSWDGTDFGDLRMTGQQIEQILARLNDDGTGILNDYKLSRLPAEIAAYYKEAFHGEGPRSARLSPIAWAKVEKAVRDAAAAAGGSAGK